jgi:hypothetical protein
MFPKFVTSLLLVALFASPSLQCMGGGSKTTTPAPTATTPTATTHTTSTTTESHTTTVGNVKTTTGRNNVVTTVEPTFIRTTETSRSQFHQHFSSRFFTRKCYSKIFCTCSWCLYVFMGAGKGAGAQGRENNSNKTYQK